MCLIKSLELLLGQKRIVVQQFEPSVFNMVVHGHKLGEMDSECT